MSVLAVDIGASSGRVMQVSLQNGKLCLAERHRFDNTPVAVNGTLYWDVLCLFSELKKGLAQADNPAGVTSVGIDTWGVDFGLLDGDGRLMENPVHYRDTRTKDSLEHILHHATREEIYRVTGIQFMPTNTLYQMTALAQKRPRMLTEAACALLIPDLLAYFLTGQKHTELTNASTTQMLRVNGEGWYTGLLERLTIPTELFPPIIYPGEVYGALLPEVAAETRLPAIPVVAVPTHDTASAVVSAPAEGTDFAFLSCGTWSLLGTETPQPYSTPEACTANFTNEIGYGHTTRLLKNIMGLWILQESRRQWQREGTPYTFAELERLARETPAFRSFIDPDAPDFVQPGDMPERIRAYCRRTGQPVPASVGEVVRCIYESLALKCGRVFRQLSAITGKHSPILHLVGGGAKDPLLAQMLADACGCAVDSGPVEATALGNAAIQLIAAGELKDVADARHMIRESFPITRFLPREANLWEQAARRFEKLLNEYPSEQ